MITILRKAPLAGSILLMLLLAASKWYFWPEFEVAMAANEWQEPLAILALFVLQALFLRYILKRNRLLLQHYFLAIFFYLFLSFQNFSQLSWHEMLLSPLVVLLAFHLIIQLYNSESTTNSLLAIGTLQGVLLIIDPSTILLLPFFLWALSYFLLLDFRKMLLVIYFMVLTAFIGYGTLYVLGLYDPEGLQIGIIWDQIEAFAADRVVASLYIAYLVLALLFILFRNRFLQMRSVKIRNVHRIFSLSIPFFLLLYLFSRQIDWNYTALLAIPFTAVFSYYFENAQKKWIYEGLFVVLMFVHFFTYGYIIHN